VHKPVPLEYYKAYTITEIKNVTGDTENHKITIVETNETKYPEPVIDGIETFSENNEQDVQNVIDYKELHQGAKNAEDILKIPIEDTNVKPITEEELLSAQTLQGRN